MMLAVAMLAWARAAGGYPVGPPVGMDQLTAPADIIFKGVATESVPVEDAWFKPCSGFIAWETRFTVISVIKGESPGSTLRFRHYDVSPLPQGRMYQPQYYHFQTNRAHIVFAKKTEVSSVYRQIWSNHKGKEDQGVLLCLDDRPLTATNAREAFWGELVAMLGTPGQRREDECLVEVPGEALGLYMALFPWHTAPLSRPPSVPPSIPLSGATPGSPASDIGALLST